jgi:hypothetical protein
VMVTGGWGAFRLQHRRQADHKSANSNEHETLPVMQKQPSLQDDDREHRCMQQILLVSKTP